MLICDLLLAYFSSLPSYCPLALFNELFNFLTTLVAGFSDSHLAYFLLCH